MKQLVLVFFVCAFMASSFAQKPGTIDPTFGKNGWVQVNISPSGDSPIALLKQADGKILSVSNRNVGQHETMTAVHRFNADGTIDLSYGDAGTAGEYLRGIDLHLTSALLQVDGKLLICGVYGDSRNAFTPGFFVERLDATGHQDMSFGGNGRVAYLFDSTATKEAQGMVLQSDGKILLVGSTTKSDSTSQIGIMRLNGDGTMDNSFDSDGKKTITMRATSNDVGSTVQLISTGKLVVVGTSMEGASSNAVIAMLNADGSMVSTFGTGGIVTTNLMAESLTIITAQVLSTGDVMLVGNLEQAGVRKGFVTRLKANGMVDATFGTAGFAYTGVNTTPAIVHRAVVTAEGIVTCTGSIAGGTSGDENVILNRFTANGLPDPTFGTNGSASFDLSGGLDAGMAVLILNDGKILTANTSNTNDFILLRLNSTASPDNTFGSSGNGRITVPRGKAIDNPNASVMLKDGSIVMAGHTAKTSDEDIALVKFLASGELDKSFGTNGITTLDFNGNTDHVFGMEMQSDGKYVVAGEEVIGGSVWKATLSRFTTDGMLDITFGDAGKKIIEYKNGDDGFWGMTLQPDDKIIGVGYTFTGSHYDALVLRFNKDGSPDNTFGVNGKVTVTADSGDMYFTPVTVFPDGKIQCGGSTNFETATIVRLNSDGSRVSTFGTNGILQIMGFRNSFDFAQTSDGGFVMNAFSQTDSTGWGTSFLKFNSNGSRDMTFGVNGEAKFDNEKDEVLEDILIQSDGKILVTGNAGTQANGSIVEYDIMMARLNADGSRDSDFGVNGLVISKPADIQSGNGLLLDKEGRILLTANISNHGEADFGLIRYISGLTVGVVDFNTTNQQLNCTNPLREENRIEFELVNAEEIEVVLYDMSGIKTQIQAPTKFDSGKHTVSFSTNQLAKGAYIIRISNGINSQDVKVIKLF